MRVLCACLGLSLLALGCNENAPAKTVEGGKATKAVDKDNTGINERDADGANKTPFDQSNDKADINLVAKIRRQVLAIDDLSVAGQNIKIMTNAGKAVLRGPVASAAERNAIVKVAQDIAGAKNVTDQLEVDAD